MRSPDIGGAIGPDVFIGRPEGLAIGWIEHYCAVITYPKRYVEKAETRSCGLGGELAIPLLLSFFLLLLSSFVGAIRLPLSFFLLLLSFFFGANPHRQVLGARRLHPGQAQVPLLVLIHGRHLDRHARTGINHPSFISLGLETPFLFTWIW